VTQDSQSKEEKLAAALRGVDSEAYGPSYRDHSLEIYKLYLDRKSVV